jgi:hypothetical protein
MLLETAPPPLSKLRLLTLSNKEDMTKGILTLALSARCASWCTQRIPAGESC